MSTRVIRAMLMLGLLFNNNTILVPESFLFKRHMSSAYFDISVIVYYHLQHVEIRLGLISPGRSTKNPALHGYFWCETNDIKSLHPAAAKNTFDCDPLTSQLKSLIVG